MSLQKYSAGIVHKVKEIQAKFKKWIADWEKEYFLENVEEPSLSDYDDSALIVNDKMMLADRILRTIEG